MSYFILKSILYIKTERNIRIARFVFKLLLILWPRGGVVLSSAIGSVPLLQDESCCTWVLLTELRSLIRLANDFLAHLFLVLNIWNIISVLSMRLVMFVRTSRCPEYRSSYLPFEENHAQNKCANLTTKIVFKKHGSQIGTVIVIVHTSVTSLFKGAQLMSICFLCVV